MKTHIWERAELSYIRGVHPYRWAKGVVAKTGDLCSESFFDLQKLLKRVKKAKIRGLTPPGSHVQERKWAERSGKAPKKQGGRLGR